MKHTLAALWKPGKGVFIREVDANLFVFQFYHEIDIKRVVDGSPWSFNRRVLVISRMKEGDIPRGVSLNTLDLWVQIHELRAGFMSENILKEIGNYVGKFIESCPNNFKPGWREYMRVRVAIDLFTPLKRRMKIRKSGAEWHWIVFKYENVPTFCFICGLMGHSEKYCSKLFEVPEKEIVKPYGSWMRAPFKKQTNLIGSRWLRDGSDDISDDSGWNTVASGVDGERKNESFTPQNQGAVVTAENQGQDRSQDRDTGANAEFLKQTNPNNSGITIIENKKRRTEYGPGHNADMEGRTELLSGLSEEDMNSMDQDMDTTIISKMDSKNGPEAGSLSGVRLAQ